jgi:ATP-binding cassette, subfamily B, bacterial
MSFPFYRQLDRIDCGPTCLRMILKHHGKVYSREYLREKSFITREGVSINGLSEAAESVGLRSLSVRVTFESLKDEAPLPCIAHWRQRHFVVVYKVTRKFVYVADPDFGLIKYTHEKFKEGWINNGVGNADEEGFLLLLEPGASFYEKEEEGAKKNVSGFSVLLPYFKPFRKYFSQLLLGLVVGTIIQVAFPFLTQSIVDHGIKTQNINFIYIILLAQLMLFFSQTLIEIFRGWLLLHMGARINISIISDFLMKMMRLPMSFFDSRRSGDILQRVEDNHRIESFLSSMSLTVIFSFFNLIIFSFILAYYNFKIFAVFLTGSILYVVWVLVFMKKRAVLDFRRFDESAGSTSNLVQLINGIQEIKLNNSEKRRRWEWESIQAKLFKISVRSLSLAQYQSTGATFLNEFKNIIITFIAAHAVINGEITLGMMLAIQYIIGQMNGPLNSFIAFMQRTQDAKISLERLGEIQTVKDENDEDENSTRILLANQNIHICNNLHFRYGGSSSPLILKDLDLEIPAGKITAIVGASGSGKTTLLKLLLKFYKPTSGNIKIGPQDLNFIQTNVWRESCGVVMQDGFIFSDSIARNITESSSEGQIDKERLQYAVKVANLEELIETFPAGYNTKIGGSGLQLSGGQKQRVLIARAVYKNPEFLFFDEATSALDANNEKVIMENLYEFFKGKTVIVIAHRLSTVKNADKIVVLHKGKIIEEGCHEDLAMKKGAYFTLVKNQLELGN